MVSPPALGNDAIFKVCPGVHYVEGSISMPPMNMITFPRGMAILSTAPDTAENEIVLVNPARLDDATEVELLKIGSVHSVVQIGLHERDMEYYKAKFDAKTYGMKSKVYKEMIGVGKPFEGTYDFDLDAGELPSVPGLCVVHFPCTPPTMKECVFAIGEKVLLTCDSFQCHEPPRGNLLSRLFAPMFGFKGKVIIGPIWLKTILTMPGDGGKEKLGDDLLPLANLRYEMLLTGQGFILDGSAKEALDQTLFATFGKKGS